MKYFVQKLLIVFIFSFAAFKANAQSVGGMTSGAAIYCASSNSGFLALGGHNGTVLTWQLSTDNGLTWTSNGNPIVTQNYTGLLQTTCYRAIVKDGSFPPDTSTVSCVEIYDASVGGTITGGGVFCISPGTGAGTLNLTGYTGDILFWQDSISGGSWNTIPDTNSSISHPNLTQNTYYRAVVRNGATCISDTSFITSFTYDSVTVAGAVSSNDTVCKDLNSGTINLTGNVGSVLNWLSSSDNGATWNLIANTTTTQSYNSLTQTTLYKAIVRNGACNTDTTAFVTISILANPVSAGNDTTVIQGQSASLHGSGNGTPFWAPSVGLSNVNIFNPLATPVNTTTYVITLTDNNSCIFTDTVMITIKILEFNGMVSNMFTPNGDGINDTWYIQDILDYPENEVFIYNIYGNQVYTKKGYANDWTGTFNGADLPDGTYYYVLRFDDDELITKGSLDILRNK